MYLVNTCEYCLETIPKLHNQIEDVIEGFEIDLADASAAPFRELINIAITALIRSLILKTDVIYSGQM